MATKLNSLTSWSTQITLLRVYSRNYRFFCCSLRAHFFTFLISLLLIPRWLWSPWLTSLFISSLRVFFVSLRLLIKCIFITLMNDLKYPIIALGLHFSSLSFIFDLRLEPNIWYFHGKRKCTSHANSRVNFNIPLKLLADLFTDRKSYAMGWIRLWHCPIISKQGKRSKDALLLLFCQTNSLICYNSLKDLLLLIINQYGCSHADNSLIRIFHCIWKKVK